MTPSAPRCDGRASASFSSMASTSKAMIWLPRSLCSNLPLILTMASSWMASAFSSYLKQMHSMCPVVSSSVERGHLRAALRELRHHGGHHAHERGGLDLLRALGQVAQLELRHARRWRPRTGCSGWSGDVDLHDLLLVGQLRGAWADSTPSGSGTSSSKPGVGIVAEQVEHGHLSAVAVLLALRGALQQRRLVHEVHELLARVAGGVERPALDEGLERLAVVALGVQAVHEVVQAGVRAVGLALGDDGLGDVRAHAAHAHQAEADAVVGGRELRRWRS